MQYMSWMIKIMFDQQFQFHSLSSTKQNYQDHLKIKSITLLHENKNGQDHFQSDHKTHFVKRILDRDHFVKKKIKITSLHFTSIEYSCVTLCPLLDSK